MVYAVSLDVISNLIRNDIEVAVGYPKYTIYKFTKYISSIGIDLNDSAKLVKNLKGDHRIPDLLKRVDQLTRN